jgi:hypothetical protein
MSDFRSGFAIGKFDRRMYLQRVSLILEGELNEYVWNGGHPAWKV